MPLSENLKRVLGVVFFAALAAGYYWYEHRPEPEEKDTPVQALVVVTRRCLMRLQTRFASIALRCSDVRPSLAVRLR